MGYSFICLACYLYFLVSRFIMWFFPPPPPPPFFPYSIFVQDSNTVLIPNFDVILIFLNFKKGRLDQEIVLASQCTVPISLAFVKWSKIWCHTCKDFQALILLPISICSFPFLHPVLFHIDANLNILSLVFGFVGEGSLGLLVFRFHGEGTDCFCSFVSYHKPLLVCDSLLFSTIYSNCPQIFAVSVICSGSIILRYSRCSSHYFYFTLYGY